MQIGNEKNIQKTHTTFLKSPTNNRPPLTYPAPHSMAICTSVHQNTDFSASQNVNFALNR